MFTILTVLLIAMLILEAVGLAYFYARDGVLFYRRTRVDGTTHPADTEPATITVLHPVLGFVQRPGLSARDIMRSPRTQDTGSAQDASWLAMRANNYGFFAADDYPSGAGEQDFIVGIVGGSVAQWLALRSAARLREGLQQLTALRGREVRVLSFAQGGFKQPQQLITLAYFIAAGQRFDLVINVDGFNEIALSHVNLSSDVSAALPSAQHLLPLIGLLEPNVASEETLTAIQHARSSRRRVSSIQAAMDRNRSAGLGVVLELMLRVASRRYAAAVARLDEASRQGGEGSLIYLNEPGDPGEPYSGTYFDPLADLWMRSSLVTSRMLEGLGIPYVHVIQPNQYYASEAVQARNAAAIRPDSPYAKAVRSGYPHLLSRVSMLRELGVHVASAIEVFDPVELPVYADDCCHYNDLGNRVLADFIVERVAAVLRQEGGSSR